MTGGEDLQIDLGVLQRESDEVYHAQRGKYLTSHLLGDFRKCPHLYFKRISGLLVDEDRPAYVLGRAVHVRVLEGRDRYNAAFAVGGPINPKTGKPFGSSTLAFAEWAAAQAKPVLTVEQAQLVESIAVGVSMNSAAVDLIVDGVAEGVVRAEWCDVACQIKMDWLNRNLGIIDLKTCDDLTWFEADARRYGYAYQVAFYQAVLAQVTGQLVPCYFIGIEKREPFRCGVWRLDDNLLADCRRENEAAIERLKDCEKSGIWPTGYEDIRTFAL